MAGFERLEELALSGDEVSRLGRAFQDPQFRELFRQYAEEISEPENRRRYEREIRALERERGVDARFLHPQPDHALRTSQGPRRCYINVCSEPLIERPEARPQAGGQQWSLPYSLATGREELDPGGAGTHLIYDVVFHPDTLRLARNSPRFKDMVDATAMEGIEKQFGVTLDKRNTETLAVPYQGVPQATVLRTPIPGATPSKEPSDSLSFPYPYEKVPGGKASAAGDGQPSKEGHPKTSGNTDAVGGGHPLKEQCPKTSNEASMAGVGHPAKEERPKTNSDARTARGEHLAKEWDPTHKTKSDLPTMPHYTITYRSYVDLQDYRYSRDSTPSPVPKELLVTIDLPLLESAGDAALDIHEKLLILESVKPAYSLRVMLPYPVDENQGTAKFNKTKRQLVVTLPVVLQKCQALMNMTLPNIEEDDAVSSDTKQLVEEVDSEVGCEGKTDKVVTDLGQEVFLSVAPVARVSQRESESYSHIEPGVPCVVELGDPSVVEAGGLTVTGQTEAWQDIMPLAEKENVMHVKKDLLGDSEMKQGQSKEPCLSVQNNQQVLLLGETKPVCPKFQCTQDNTSVMLIIHVPCIDQKGFNSDVSTSHYRISFSSEDTHIFYSLVFRCILGNKLNTNEVTVCISKNNAVIQLSKALESSGLWEKFCFGLNEDNLQERLFVSEENVDRFLQGIANPPSLTHSASEIQPVIEVLEVTDKRSLIRLKEPVTKNSDPPAQSEQSINNTDDDKKKHAIGLHPENSTATDTAERQHTTENDEPSVSLTNGATVEKLGHGSGLCVKPEPDDGSLALPGESQIIESGLKADATTGKCATSFHAVKQRILRSKEETAIKEEELDEDDIPRELQDIVLNNSVGSPIIEEINPDDGSVHVITDHTTHCAFSFQNSLLYDLD